MGRILKTSHKITLGTIATIIAITAGLFTIIEKTPNVINVISEVMKADASDIPDSVIVTKGIAGNIKKEFVQEKPKKGKN